MNVLQRVQDRKFNEIHQFPGNFMKIHENGGISLNCAFWGFPHFWPPGGGGETEEGWQDGRMHGRTGGLEEDARLGSW